MKRSSKTRLAPISLAAAGTGFVGESDVTPDDDASLAVGVTDAFARFAASVAQEPVPEVWLRPRQATDGPAKLDWCSEDGNAREADEDESRVLNGMSTPAVVTPQASESVGAHRRANRWLARTLIGAAAVVAVTSVFASGLGGRAIAAIFETFTIHHLQTINSDDIYALRNELQQLQSTGQVINLSQYGQVKTAPTGTTKQLTSLAEAASLVHHPVQPLVGQQGVVIRYIPGVDATFTVHVKNVNALISRLGGSDMFPQSADNQPIQVHVPAVIEQTAGNGMQLDQIEVPTVDVPSGVDVNQVRHALLALPFLPPDLSQKLSGTVDWKDTLFVPSNGPEQKGTVNGHDAVLSPTRGWIMWLDGGTILRLMMPVTDGSVTAEQLLAAATGISS